MNKQKKFGAATLLATTIAMSSFSGTALAGDAAAGQTKSATCAACHGPDGNSQIPGNPIIAGQYEDYLIHSLNEYKSGARNNPIMMGMTAGLSDEDIADLSAWFSSQNGLAILPNEPAE
jgi:cytochrome c553